MNISSQTEIIEYIQRVLGENDETLGAKQEELSHVLLTLAALNNDIEIPNNIRKLSEKIKARSLNPQKIRQELKDLLISWDKYLFRINQKSTKYENGKQGILITVITISVSIISLIIGDQGITQFLGETESKSSSDTIIPSLFWPSLIQGFFLLFFFLFTTTKTGSYKIRRKNNDNEKLHLVFKQFTFGWRALWLVWAFLFLWFTLWWGKTLHIGDTWGWAIADILNGLTALCFFNLFIVMDMPSYNTVEYPNRKNKFNLYRILYFSLCGVVIFVSVIGRFDVIPHMGNGGNIVLSLLVAIAMMHFFGRLDSTYLNINRLALIPFYIYAAIQVTWNNFSDNPGLMAIIFFFAFLLKINVAYSITRWLRSGNFEDYFLTVPEAYDKAQMRSKNNTQI